MSTPGEDLRQAVGRKGSFLGTLQAVAWSFLGIRRRAGLEKDVQQLNPVHVIVAGVVAAVQWVIGSGVAA